MSMRRHAGQRGAIANPCARVSRVAPKLRVIVLRSIVLRSIVLLAIVLPASVPVGASPTMNLELLGGAQSGTFTPGAVCRIQIVLDADGSATPLDNWVGGAQTKIEVSSADVLEVLGPATAGGTEPAYDTPAWHQSNLFALPVPNGTINVVTAGNLGSKVDTGDLAGITWSRTRMATLDVKIADSAPNGAYEIRAVDARIALVTQVNGSNQPVDYQDVVIGTGSVITLTVDDSFALIPTVSHHGMIAVAVLLVVTGAALVRLRRRQGSAT